MRGEKTEFRILSFWRADYRLFMRYELCLTYVLDSTIIYHSYLMMFYHHLRRLCGRHGDGFSVGF